MLINGQKCKILGRVTMDQTIVDVTKVAQVKPGQIATLIGTDGNASISLTQYADFSDSIPYESLCSITKRVQRVYKFAE